jgi:hypothetical protein
MAHRITSQAIKLDLDGTEYEFRLDFTAMADFEQASGKGVLDLFGDVLQTLMAAGAGAEKGAQLDWAALLKIKEVLAPTDLQALIWACLGGEDSGVSLREAGRLIHAGNLAEVIVALAKTIRNALPAVKPEDEQSHPPAAEAAVGPDGSPSGPSADSLSD